MRVIRVVQICFLLALTSPPLSSTQDGKVKDHKHDNSSCNNTTKNDYRKHPGRETFENALSSCFAITALVSLIGNGLVIHVVRTTPSMHTSVNVYIANMAVSDVISTMVCTPLMMKRLSQSYEWLEGTRGLVLCKLVFFFFYSSFACSTFNHVVIAFDRYLAVSKPLFRYSKRMVKVIVASIWLVSGALSIPITNGYQLKSYRSDITTLCYDSDRDDVYNLGVTTMAIMCYGIPLLLATVLYALTGHRLRMRSKESIGNNSESHRRQATKMAYKAIKLMVTIVTVFSLCWAPFFVYHLTKAWYRGRIYEALEWYYRPLSFLLASTNASINPCLYFIFNDNFRSRLTDLLCRFKKPRSESLTMELQSSRVRSRSRTFS